MKGKKMENKNLNVRKLASSVGKGVESRILK